MDAHEKVLEILRYASLEELQRLAQAALDARGLALTAVQLDNAVGVKVGEGSVILYRVTADDDRPMYSLALKRTSTAKAEYAACIYPAPAAVVFARMAQYLCSTQSF
jgi:hypothetical protein